MTSLLLCMLGCIPFSIPTSYILIRSLSTIMNEKIIIFSRLIQTRYLGTVFNKHTAFFLAFTGNELAAVLYLNVCLFLLKIALRMPLSLGSVAFILTTNASNTRTMACEIFRDVNSLSIGTTNIWVIVSIMFR